MKKITLLLLLFIISQSNAQVVASANFDTALGWTASNTTSWARRTTGGAPACSTFAGAGMARFYSYNIAAGGTARLTSPAITFTGATYRVKFRMFRDAGYAGDLDNVKLYYNTTGAAGGTLLGTVNRSRTQAPIEAEDGWYSYSFDIPGTLTGTGYVHFLGTSAYGNNIFIDEVQVAQIPAVDAEMRLLTVNSYVPIGDTSIAGTFKNSGTSTINTADILWQLDSGATYTQSVSGLNLAPGQTYNISHSNLWNGTAGEVHSLKLSVSNINGAGNDADTTNDLVSKSVSVYSAISPRFPLYEKFSSATCPPCYSFNTGGYNAFFDANHTDFAGIAYQVNWPGSGDPYYTAEIGSRVSYYGISGAPTLLVDSKDGTNNNVTGAFNTEAELTANLTTAATAPSYFTINASRTIVGSDITVNVTVDPFVSGTYKLYTAVVEKVTTGNVATNGEVEFHNVMMKMLPDASGTTINFSNGVASNTVLNAALTGLFIEDLSDLDVIVFIQNPATKGIMQSKIAIDGLLSTGQFASTKFKIYPNPSTGIVKIATEIPVDVTITDITGKTVFTMSQVTNDTQMNLSSLQKGMYLAKITGEGTVENKKFILK